MKPLYQRLFEIVDDLEDKRSIVLKDRDGKQRTYYHITTTHSGNKLYSPIKEGELYTQPTVTIDYLIRTAIIGGKDEN